MPIQVNPVRDYKCEGKAQGKRISNGVKTMRDIWDSKEKKARKYPLFTYKKTFPPDIEKYHSDYPARKKAFLETKEEIVRIFADYEKHLGGAGFSKI